MFFLKATSETATLPLPGESLLEKGQAILTAVSEVRITPEQGNHLLLAALADYRNLAEKESPLKRHRDSQETVFQLQAESLG